MATHDLQAHLAAVQGRLRDLPVPVQRRLMASFMDQLDDAMHAVADEHPDWGRDDVVSYVLGRLPAPIDLEIRYGEQGGLLDRRTGELLVASPIMVSPDAKKAQPPQMAPRAAAAAGLTVFVIVAAVALLLWQPPALFGDPDDAKQPLQDWGPTTPDERVIVDATYRALSDDATFAFRVNASEAPFDLAIDVASTAGCIDVYVTNPLGSEWRQGLCGSWGLSQPFSGEGDWTLRILAEDFSGRFQATWTPQPTAATPRP